jgi:hypothetical protein
MYERVRERGYDSLTAFAEARPTASLVALAEELGPDDVVGAQVLSGLLAEAEQRKQLTRFVRDVLVRELAVCLPDGWSAVLDDGNRFKVAKALGSWIADTPMPHKERARQVRTAFLATPPPPPDGARSAPTTSCCSRSCLTKKPDPPLPLQERALLKTSQSHGRAQRSRQATSTEGTSRCRG